MCAQAHFADYYYSENRDFCMSHVAFSTAAPLYPFTPHMHHGYEVYMFLEGSASYSVEGHVYTMQPYDIFITNRREVHRLIFSEDCYYRRKNILVYPSFLSEFITAKFNPFAAFDSMQLGTSNKFDHTIVKQHGIDLLIDKIEATMAEDKPERDVLTKAYLLELLIKLAKYIDRTSAFNPKDSTISAILDYIHRHLNEELTYESISRQFFINQDYLYKYFMSNSGFALGDYIRCKRILRAKELLVSGTSPTEIPGMVGFHDYSTFYRAFIKSVGKSPTAYIKSIK